MLVAAAVAAVAVARAADFHVVAVGEMRNVMQRGDLSAAVDLRQLSNIQNLYALGPIAGLKGEITVWDSRPSIARIVAGEVKTSERNDVGACFLVYASVPAWQEVAIPEEVKDAAQLETFVSKTAERLKIKGAHAFPFAVKGKFERVTFHVVDKTDDAPHSREKA
jgi:acetolactate decarboxylase